MKATIQALVVGLVSSLTLSIAAQAAEAPTVTRADGGSIQTALSPSIVLNQGSSLRREWIAIRDPGMSARILGTPGVSVVYDPGDRYERASYKYVAKFTLDVTEPITAVQVRFLTFDIWGQRRKNLVSTEVTDVPVGRKEFSAKWSLHDENEASECYASIAYVARVRTKSGRVLEADLGPIVAEAKRFSSKFTLEDVEREDKR